MWVTLVLVLSSAWPWPLNLPTAAIGSDVLNLPPYTVSCVFCVLVLGLCPLCLCHCLSISPCVCVLTLCAFLHVFLSVSSLPAALYLHHFPSCLGSPAAQPLFTYFNSQLLSSQSPSLAAGHSKQNVRKQKLMSSFRESRESLLRV